MLRIATYNVFEGGHRRLGTVADRPSKLTAAVAGLAPDVIALQELVGWQERGRASFNEFAAATGLEGELLVGNGFPLAMLARPPWRISGARFISNGLWHGIISARLEGGAGRPVQVIAIHLPPRSPDQRLGEIETALSQITGDLPVVLLGDMNLISHRDGVLPAELALATFIRHSSVGALDTRVSKRLEGSGLVDAYRRYRPSGSGHTIPTPAADEAAFSPARLDYIFLSGGLSERIKRAFVYRASPAGLASDHFPLAVDIAGY